MELSNLVRNTSGSAIREMFNLALTMEDTIRFTVGEPDFITPDRIIDEACKYWKKGLTHYTPNRGILELREALAEYHKDDIHPNPERIMISCGATEAIQLALFTVCNPGDEVIVVTPAWPNYFGQVAMTGAKLVTVPALEENDFIVKAADIEKAITSKTKCIILNSPSNPTGAVIDRQSYQEIYRLLADKDIFVIADEIYNRLVYTDSGFTSFTEFEGLTEKIIYISGFSKMLAMTGWRIGYAIANEEIIDQMTKLHENGASNLPAPSQLAAVAGLKHCMSDVEEMRTTYEHRRDLICSLINEVPGMSIRKPKGAFYAFVNIKEFGVDSKTFCTDLLQKTGVVTVPGSGFGDAGEGYIRLTYATSDENIIEGMRRIKRYAETIRK